MGRQQAWITHALLSVSCWAVVLGYPYYPRPRRDLEINPEENLGSNLYLQGDIMISRTDAAWQNHSLSGPHIEVPVENAVRDNYLTWNNRTVPYVLDTHTMNASEQEMVLDAMREISSQSCVKFQERRKEFDYINIIKMQGCSSSVGRMGGMQNVVLGEGCYVNGIILHELMHALGFWHEHSRPDRDTYIQIIWNNVAQEHWTNFEKYDNSTIDTLGTVYDYGSVMHYKNNTFAMDRSRITINAKFPIPPDVVMGQRVKLSDTDIIKINRLYKCNITNCMDPGVPLNGVRRVSNETFPVGTVVSFSCNHGYQRYGSRERSCLDLGQWTGHVPSCLPDPKGELHICTFDGPGRPMCGWTPDTTAPRNWTLHNRSTPSNGTGPMEDHTMGSPEGWYIYLETTPPKAYDKARLMSPPLRFNTSFLPSSRICMMFYYCMHGKEIGALHVYQRNIGGATGSHGELIYNKTGEQGPGWKLATITLLRMNFFTIVLEAVSGHGYLGDIAIDDVAIGPCSSLSHLHTDEVADTFKCSFDSGLCGFDQDLQDDFDWRRCRGETPSRSTGPKCDPINCATGYYIYTESSSPRVANETARILTPLLHGDGMGRCVLFFWSMHGYSMGALEVRMVVDGSEQLLWTRIGNPTSRWHYEKIDLVQPPRFYKLAFSGTLGSTITNDMALDNVEVVVGECDDVVHNDCTFHEDMCSWENMGHLMWRRNYGDTPTPGTGPLADHNNNPMEFYLYVESSRTRPNDTARLRSDRISGHLPGHCLQFWYHMHGSDIGSLLVRAEDDTTGSEATLWQHTGSAGSMWHRQSLYVRRPAQEFRLTFEARLTGGMEGDIAIDDIFVHSGPCESQ